MNNHLKIIQQYCMCKTESHCTFCFISLYPCAPYNLLERRVCCRVPAGVVSPSPDVIPKHFVACPFLRKYRCGRSILQCTRLCTCMCLCV